ncbi:respiration control sensor protein ArcB [Seminavis robusta]|uniref:Respiration control sensor protein ArcB n=1 Tax=Seminavis robusta TaxID=568900 RepID=A0A9N8DXT6_9STRA|nr:respiration control sensor protein ArcB [Seminavis robusta]|eukprot:Sro326_g118130.1 respiration control sensor protein ArcB (1014) ;mRNA; r:41401-44701
MLSALSKLNATKATTSETDKMSDNNIDENMSSDYSDLQSEKVSMRRLARRQTRAIHGLRLCFLSLLLVTGAVVAASVFLYTRNAQEATFSTLFEDAALEIMDKFHGTVEKNLQASTTLSSYITSYAVQHNLSFPYVTVPDFELFGSHLRSVSGSHIVHWMPFVTDLQREDWEDYAGDKRFQIDDSFVRDQRYRTLQDEEFHVDTTSTSNNQNATKVPVQAPKQDLSGVTILDDGTGYHPKIFSNQKGVPSDDSVGAGPFMVLWQRSPINHAKQKTLNTNWAKLPILAPDLIGTMTREQKALINTASVPPSDYFKAGQEKNLKLSQYRQDTESLINGPSTYLTYPVFDSLLASSESRSVKGVLATSIYWKVLFSNLLPAHGAPQGIICVVQNSLNQFFSFQIDGPQATFLGFGDFHDPSFDAYEYAESIHSYLDARAGPRNRPYTSVSLSDSVEYTLRVYPSVETRDEFVTNEPVGFMMAFVAAFVLASVLFVLFSYLVERRQEIMMEKVITNAQRAASAERELNEFMSHEVRNPLAVAMTACSFVTSAVMDDPKQLLEDAETRQDVCNDLRVVNSSLNFINDFLRSMLDTHRASSGKIKINMAPTDVLRDILQPVASILYNRASNFQLLVECDPTDLVIMSDKIRLKQVVLNLARNSTKFVQHGYVRLRAEVDPVTNQCRIYVEDSGTGIPKEKRKTIFDKYQESLDLLSQGTGVGLCLCKKLMHLMDGDIWLDQDYHSSLKGLPGARFVVEVNAAPLDIDTAVSKTMRKDDDTFATMAETTRASVEGTAMPGVRLLDDSIRISEMQDSKSSSPASSEVEGEADSKSTPVLPAAPMVPPSEPSLAPSSSTIQPSPLVSSPSDKPPAAAPQGLLPQGLSVLFTDDDAMLRKLFVRATKRAVPSWCIEEASCGETALEMCASKSYDLIFMDMYMSSVNKQLLGTETIQQLRSRGIRSVICGLSANDIRERFVKAGADDFILKPLPCKPDQLTKMLADLLSLRADDGGTNSETMDA